MAAKMISPEQPIRLPMPIPGAGVGVPAGGAPGSGATTYGPDGTMLTTMSGGGGGGLGLGGGGLYGLLLQAMRQKQWEKARAFDLQEQALRASEKAARPQQVAEAEAPGQHGPIDMNAGHSRLGKDNQFLGGDVRYGGQIAAGVGGVGENANDRNKPPYDPNGDALKKILAGSYSGDKDELNRMTRQSDQEYNDRMRAGEGRPAPEGGAKPGAPAAGAPPAAPAPATGTAQVGQGATASTLPGTAPPPQTATASPVAAGSAYQPVAMLGWGGLPGGAQSPGAMAGGWMSPTGYQFNPNAMMNMLGGPVPGASGPMTGMV